MATIIKSQILVTVLHYRDEPFPEDWDLQFIHEAITDGSMIGEFSEVSAEELDTPEVVRRELEAIGNDGEFFREFSADADDDDDEHEDWLAGRVEAHKAQAEGRCAVCGCDLHAGQCPEGCVTDDGNEA